MSCVLRGYSMEMILLPWDFLRALFLARSLMLLRMRSLTGRYQRPRRRAGWSWIAGLISCRDDIRRLEKRLRNISMHVEQTECALRLRSLLKPMVVLFLIIFLFAGCAGRRSYSSRPKAIEKPLSRLGYTFRLAPFPMSEMPPG